MSTHHNQRKRGGIGIASLSATPPPALPLNPLWAPLAMPGPHEVTLLQTLIDYIDVKKLR